MCFEAAVCSVNVNCPNAAILVDDFWLAIIKEHLSLAFTTAVLIHFRVSDLNAN